MQAQEVRHKTHDLPKVKAEDSVVEEVNQGAASSAISKTLTTEEVAHRSKWSAQSANATSP